MVVYNFKTITQVPGAKELIDSVLSKTQRKTPTEIHPQYAISRIRGFYTRKVKYTQQNFNESLSQVLDEFPQIGDIHPFYADLLNVLYDRAHYKLALGQVRQTRVMIDNISKEYVRQLKYGESLFRCKALKRAALGRMCTIAKKLVPTMAYLEQVRQHMSRLPAIDPTMRSLILTGMPSVGKSSFINVITRANVDVQPYAFTTKSLLVGHTDYKLMRWQVIDTPGLLDHSLEERNTIEMQAITALAHLRAAVVFMLDPSATCGQSVESQINLFRSIRPLFAGKPLVVVLNKSDIWAEGYDNLTTEQAGECLRAYLDDEEFQMISTMNVLPDGSVDPNVTILPTCTATKEGVIGVKTAACERLLEMRAAEKMTSDRTSSRVQERLYVAQPNTPANNAVIPPAIVEARVMRERELRRLVAEDQGQGIPADVQVALPDDGQGGVVVDGVRYRTLKDAQEALGGAGVYNYDWREHALLENPEERYDVVPEIWEDLNVADFIDPDIEAKLNALEAEEAALLAEFEEKYDPEVFEKFMELQRSKHNAHVPASFGKETITAERSRAFQEEHGLAGLTEDELARRLKVSRGAAEERSARRVKPEPKLLKRSDALQKRALKSRASEARKGVADRAIYDLMPKHLFSGKSSLGTKTNGF